MLYLYFAFPFPVGGSQRSIAIDVRERMTCAKKNIDAPVVNWSSAYCPVSISVLHVC
jgi:hypothetical protein